MSIRFNFKQRKAKSRELPPSSCMSASGPTESFTEKARRILYIHGFEPVSKIEGHEVWATDYEIGGTPVYLPELMKVSLNRKGKGPLVRMTPEMATTLARAVSYLEPEDTISHFFGGEDPRKMPGRQALSIQKVGKNYIANCDEGNFDRRFMLESAGMLPVVAASDKLKSHFGTRPYRTADAVVASSVEPWMTKAAKEALSADLKEVVRLNKLSRSTEEPEGFSIPAPEGKTFLDYQVSGIHFHHTTGESGVIADETGLGKTMQAIGLMNIRPDLKSAVVFCQANMKLKFAESLVDWLANRKLTVGYVEGGSFPDTDIVVCNYDLAARHEARFRAKTWDILIADEAQRLKELDAQWTNAILGEPHLDNGKPMIPVSKGGFHPMSATPKPNRVNEFWPLLSRTRPDLWGVGSEAKRIFDTLYQPPKLIEKDGRTLRIPGKKGRRLLEFNLRVHQMTSHHSKDAVDLPPKTRTSWPLAIKLTPDEMDALRQAEVDLLAIHQRIERDAGRTPQPGSVTQLAGVIIDQVSGLSEQSARFEEIARVRRNIGMVKAPYVADLVIQKVQDDILAGTDDEKHVIFAHHKDVIKLIRDRLEAQWPGSTIVYDGSVATAKKRQALVDDFQTNPRRKFFIMSRAGETGITVTAATHNWIAEIDYAPSTMWQVEDRIWRIGQMKPCSIFYPFMPGTFEVAIGNTVIEKMKINDLAMNPITFRHMKELQESVANGGGRAPARPRAPRNDAQPAFDF